MVSNETWKYPEFTVSPVGYQNSVVIYNILFVLVGDVQIYLGIFSICPVYTMWHCLVIVSFYRNARLVVEMRLRGIYVTFCAVPVHSLHVICFMSI